MLSVEGLVSIFTSTIDWIIEPLEQEICRDSERMLRSYNDETDAVSMLNTASGSINGGGSCENVFICGLSTVYYGISG